MKDSCSTRRHDSINEIYKWTPLKNITKLGYPRIESWDFNIKSSYRFYSEHIQKEGLFDLESADPNSDQVKYNEAYVDFTQVHPQVNINLKKNESLILERNQTLEQSLKNNDAPVKNILFIFIDSISRNHMRRKLKRLYSWIEKRYESDSSEKHEAFQLLKYHTIGPWTNANLEPFYFGIPYTADNCLLYTSPSPRDKRQSRMPSSA
eukprot:TRINITY_DN3976_c0_g1_i1.p2 TRINITY_DN3976_c0_g1~~TRINITY_DN3976_c0_g1_i1.p2  ORF type:complete len:207 (+),score=35.46 TRINITY_DN3976_c0_g1_i1:163-783(+)